MKNVYYDAGPNQLWVGPKNNQTLMTRGVAVPFDDAIADALLKKPMFKEQVNQAPEKSTGKGGK